MSFQLKFIPPNTTSLIQPMDQCIISVFKKLYTKFLFEYMYEECYAELAKNVVIHFWKKEFNIVKCIWLITRAYTKINKRTLVHAWKGLCGSDSEWLLGTGGQGLPDDQDRNDPDKTNDPDVIVGEIIKTAQNLSMDAIDGEDLAGHFKALDIV